MIIGRGVLPQSSKLIIGGQPKRGKSFFATAIGLDLAQGRNLFGATYPNGSPVFPVFGKSRVLYIEKELGHFSMRERFKQMTQGMDVSNIDFFVKTRDADMRLDDKQTAKLQAEIESVQPQVVILDPYTNFHGYDENSNQEMSSIMRTLDRWQDNYKCSFIIVHHIGHQQKDFQRQGGDALRGASSIYGAVDSVILFKRISGPNIEEPVIQIEPEVKSGAPIENMRLKKLKSGLFVYTGPAEGSNDHEIHHRQHALATRSMP